MGLAGRRQDRTTAGNKVNLPVETGFLVSSRVINACFQALLLKVFYGFLLRTMDERSEAAQIKGCAL